MQSNGTTRRRLLAAMAALAMVGAACGGGGGDKKASKASPDTTQVDSTATTVGFEGTTTTASTAAVPGTSGATAGGTPTTAARKTTPSTRGAAAPKLVSNAGATPLVNVTAPPATTATGEEAQPGGTLTYISPVEMAGYDIVQINGSYGNDGPRDAAVFDMLAYNDPNDGGVKPQIAESVTSSDGKTWTLKLRPNVKFTDGTSYDAAAVQFNWKRHQDPANKSGQASSANQIATIETPDPLTVRVTLKDPNNQWPRVLAKRLPYIGSPTALADPGKFASNPVGAGPFILKQWLRDSQAVFDRNPGYWNAPRPYADQLVIRVAGDEEQRLNSFLAGEANLSVTSSIASADRARKAGNQTPVITFSGGADLVFNMTKAPFNDIRLRKAVTMGIDRDAYAKTVLAGIVPGVHTIFNASSKFYDTGIQELAYNPTEAQRLFDEVAAAQGGPVEFTLGTFTSTAQRQAAEFFQAQLAKFKNVNVKFDAAAPINAQTRVLAKDYQVHVWSNSFDDPDPAFNDNFTTGNGANVTGFSDSTVDNLFKTARQTLDVNARAQAYKDAQKAINASVPAFYYEYSARYTLAKPEMRNVTMYEDGIPMWDRMWIKR